MGQWIEQFVLAAVYCLVLSTVERQVTTNLTVCEGDAADFPNNYSLGGYRRVFFTVHNTDGKSLHMYRLNFDETKPTIHEDYKERFSLKSPSEVGFTIKNVGTTDAGNYSCLIVYNDGTEKKFKWILQVKDRTTRHKRSTSSAPPGEASDDCDGDTESAIEEDKQNTGMGAGIGIGFSIASVALIAVLVYLYKRRKADKDDNKVERNEKKDSNKDEIKENGIVTPLVHCIQEESRGDCKN